jgi:surfeit locus 1 family protein
MQAFYGRGRVGAASVAALAVVILGLALGFWQLRRADEKAQLQAARDEAAAAPALRLDAGSEGAAGSDGSAATQPAPLPPPAAIDGKGVTARGVFVAERTVFLDNRTREGVAGFHVLTPLKLLGRDSYLLVLRGWIARDPYDRSRLPLLETPSEVVEVEGEAVARLAQPMRLGEEAPPGPQDRLWQHFEYDRFSQWAGMAPYPVILRQTVEPGYRDRLARDWNQPGVSVDRHRGYAFQWFALTAAAIVTWLTLLRRQKTKSDGDRTKQ